MASADPRRRLPSIEQILRDPGVRALEERFARGPLLRHARGLVDDARARAAAGDEAGVDEALADVPGALRRRLEGAGAPSLVHVINATGEVIPTNLGRAPLSPEAAARVAQVAASYTNLEMDLAAGQRGDRES